MPNVFPKNSAIRSYTNFPTSSSGKRAIAASSDEGPSSPPAAKTWAMVRWREGAEGAVNSKTAGPVRATLIPWGTMGWSTW